MQSPGHIYDIVKSERLTTPRTSVYKFNALQTTFRRETENKVKIPEHGQYDSPGAFRNTQINGAEKAAYKIVKDNLKTFTEEYIQQRKFVPGVGHYKNVEESYK